METKRAMIRVDASAQIGIGHVKRCLTLADALVERGWHCDFFCKNHANNAGRLIREKGFSVYEIPVQSNNNTWLASTEEFDASFCLELMSGISYTLALVDHYSISANWETLISGAVKKILVIDDLADRKHNCDLLLDTGSGRTRTDYQFLVPAHTKFLLGTDFTLLHKRFTSLRQAAEIKRADTKAIHNVLIGYGGSDPKHLSQRTISALLDSGYKGSINVVMTSTCEWIEDLKEQVSRYANVFLWVDTESTAELIFEADFAFGSAGVMMLERCFLGLPSFVVMVAENQQINIEALLTHSAGEVVSIDNIEGCIQAMVNSQGDLTVSNWSQLSKNAFEFMSVNGVTRVADSVECLLGYLTLARATQGQCDLLFAWQCQPETRQYFNNPNPPSYDEHRTWYEAMLHSDVKRFWFIVLGEREIGYIRLDDCEQYEEVSIYVHPQYQNLGVAHWSLDQAKQLSKYGVLRAVVQDVNAPSKRLFTKSGFINKQLSGLEWNGREAKGGVL